LWWLFLHRRLRPGNEAQLSSSRFAPFGGSSSEESHSFLSEWFKKASRLSLAEPFGFDSRRHRINSRLFLLSPSASPHRSPIPSSVSKAVTFVTCALYLASFLPSTFSLFYFSRLTMVTRNQRDRLGSSRICVQKNEMRRLQQAESSAIRFLIFH